MKQLQEITNTLKLLGLTDIEINVYLEILRIGNMPASTVANRLKINRSTTRYTLENLVKKRFVFQTDKNGTYHFTAEEPEKILILLKNQKEVIDKKEAAVEKVLGDLKNLQNPHSTLPKVRFFEGVEGIINMYQDILNESEQTGCTIYGFTHSDFTDFYPGIWEYLQDKYVPKRKEIGNKSFMIFNNDTSNNEYRKTDDEMNRTALMVPKEKFNLSSCYQIYNNKLAFFSRKKGENPNGVIIENEEIRRNQFILFKMAWEMAQQLPINKDVKNTNLE